MCNKQNPERQAPGFFYHYCEQLSFIFLKNGIEQCKEGDRCHRSSYDIAYRFCQENSERFVREEIRQQEDQRDQHDHDPEEDRASNLGMFPVAIGFEVFDSCILVMVLVLLFVN